MYINRVIVVGNITKDPELKSLPSGVKVAGFGLATNRTWKSKEGAKQEKTEFHNIIAFGKQAELITQYMKKGSQMLVEGRIETRSWEDKESGKKNYRTEIIVENFQFGARKELKVETKSEAIDDLKQEMNEKSDEIKYPDEEINIEDIPF